MNANDNINTAKQILGTASESEKSKGPMFDESNAIEAGGGTWRKVGVTEGEHFDGMFVGYELEPDKFNPGKQRTVATWKELNSDVEFKTSCPSDLANLVARLSQGRAYRIVYAGTVRTSKGYNVKKFRAYPARADTDLPF